MIRIIASLIMVVGLMIFTLGVNDGLKSISTETHMGWRAKTQSVKDQTNDTSFVARFIKSFEDVIAAEKEPPKSDLQRLLDRRRRDTAPFDLGNDLPLPNQISR